VLIAHEMSHIIRRHGQRLDALHVHRGLLSEFGHDASIIRATEDEADQLSVHLLANAGYDPQIAVTFWKNEGRRIYPPLIHSPTHGSPGERAALIQAEITRMGCHIGGCDRGDIPVSPRSNSAQRPGQ
jgi:predicted Zn-dependent protease